MPTKVRELDNTKQGDRNACVTCNPRTDRIPMWKVWQFSLTHPGEPVFRESTGT